MSLVATNFTRNGSDNRMEQPRGSCKAFLKKDLLAVTERCRARRETREGFPTKLAKPGTETVPELAGEDARAT